MFTYLLMSPLWRGDCLFSGKNSCVPTFYCSSGILVKIPLLEVDVGWTYPPHFLSDGIPELRA